MTNEIDAFLGDLKDEEKDPFKLETEDPLALKEEVAEKEEEEKLPFHKDPKVQRFIEKEIERRMPQKETIIEREVSRDESVDPLTDVLTRIIGNDTPEKISAIKDFQRALESREERVRQEALDEIDQRVDEEHEAEVEATNELVRGFEDIEDTFGVDITSNKPSAVSTRREFVDFIQRVAPKDDEGQVIEFPDLEETFKLFQDTKRGQAQPNNRAKELAARSINRSGDASTVPQQKDTSWRGVEKWLQGLTN